MSRPCSLRTASSNSLASSGMLSGDMVSKATPPAQSVELWHFSQYCPKKVHLLLGSKCGLDVSPALAVTSLLAAPCPFVSGAGCAGVSDFCDSSADPLGAGVACGA